VFQASSRNTRPQPQNARSSPCRACYRRRPSSAALQVRRRLPSSLLHPPSSLHPQGSVPPQVWLPSAPAAAAPFFSPLLQPIAPAHCYLCASRQCPLLHRPAAEGLACNLCASRQCLTSALTALPHLCANCQCPFALVDAYQKEE
jgi:hypothetical protein